MDKNQWKVAALIVAGAVVVLATLFSAVRDPRLAWQSDLDTTNDQVKEILEYREQFVKKDDLEKLEREVEALKNLKNVDNQWYRELSDQVAATGADVSHLKDALRDVQSDIKELIKMSARGG